MRASQTTRFHPALHARVSFHTTVPLCLMLPLRPPMAFRLKLCGCRWPARRSLTGSRCYSPGPLADWIVAIKSIAKKIWSQFRFRRFQQNQKLIVAKLVKGFSKRDKCSKNSKKCLAAAPHEEIWFQQKNTRFQQIKSALLLAEPPLQLREKSRFHSH